MAIPPEEITAQRLAGALLRLRQIHSDMTIQQAAALLFIAGNPGITQRRVWALLDISDGVASRTLAILGEYGSRGTQPLGLIEVRADLNDRRNRICRLTPKGERLIGQIHADLYGAKGGDA
jgi:DNA-binding MarR family transcriptional regulator